MQRSCFKKYISINPQAVFFVFVFVFRRNDVARNTLLKYFITKGSSFFFSYGNQDKCLFQKH